MRNTRNLIFLVAISLMFFTGSAQINAPGDYDNSEGTSSGFIFYHTNTFDVKEGPSISVWCDKSDVAIEGGCPGPSGNQDIDSTEGDEPIVLDNWEITNVCGSSAKAKIVDDDQEWRVYDPAIPGNVMDEFGCGYGYSQGSRSADYTFTDGETVAPSGGSVYTARTEGTTFTIFMNTEASTPINSPDGSKGDLSSFKFQDDDQGVKIIEYKTGVGNDIDTRTPKKNYVFNSDSKNINNFLSNPYTPENGERSNCGSGPCKIAKTEFVRDTADVNVGDCSYSDRNPHKCPLGFDLSSRTVSYQLGGKDTKAQIVYGKEYGGEFNPSVSETTAQNKFHLCHDTVPSLDGKTVYSPLPEDAGYSTENEYDQFICQNGGWKNVATCNDGRDNNQNGKIDHEADPVCDGNKGQPETSVSCDEPVVAYDDNDQKAAFYDPVESGEDLAGAVSPRTESPYFSCRYNQKETVAQLEYDAESQEPVNFECTTEENPLAGGETGTSTGYSGSSQEKADNFCRNRYSSVGSFAQDPMPAVQYFVPGEVIPTGPGKWATSSGFKPNIGFQTLHQAESYYSSNSNQGPHDAERWNSMQDIYGYENDNPSEYQDAWITANAGDLNENVASSGGELGDNPVFEGGFAGKCNSPEKWTNVNEEFNIWDCDIPTGDTTITVNTYAMQTSGIEGNYAGIQVKRSELEKWEGAHGVPPSGNDHTGRLILLAECWHGGPEPDDMPPEGERARMSAGISSLGEQVVVADEIPPRSNGPSQLTEGQYSCTYGFTQKINDKQAAGVPETTPLFQNGGAANNQGWIVEGTQEFGKVKTNVETISVPYTSEYENEDNPEQAWLEDQASNVNTFSSGEDTYQHFPTEGTHPDEGSVRDPYNQMRHPVEVFKGR
ncbi:MAG: hypothetical protein ACI8Z7_000632 [Candidatus Nanohaloarchaea archaeon]|jgi:hypothetical protein